MLIKKKYLSMWKIIKGITDVKYHLSLYKLESYSYLKLRTIFYHSSVQFFSAMLWVYGYMFAFNFRNNTFRNHKK